MPRALVAILLFNVGFALRARSACAQEGPPAGEDLDAVRPYSPPSAAKSVEIGNYYLRTKKYNAALSRFQEAVKTDPDYSPAYLGLGKVYEKIGLKQKALAAYQKFLDTLPSAKDAEEAKQVHQAMVRLDRGLKTKSRPRQSPSSVVTDPAGPP